MSGKPRAQKEIIASLVWLCFCCFPVGNWFRLVNWFLRLIDIEVDYCDRCLVMSFSSHKKKQTPAEWSSSSSSRLVFHASVWYTINGGCPNPVTMSEYIYIYTIYSFFMKQTLLILTFIFHCEALFKQDPLIWQWHDSDLSRWSPRFGYFIRACPTVVWRNPFTTAPWCVFFQKICQMSNQNIVFSKASKIGKHRFSGAMLELGRSREVKKSWLSPKFGIMTLWTMEWVGRSEVLMYDLNRRKKHNGQKDTLSTCWQEQTSRFKFLPIGSMYGINSHPFTINL